MAAARRNRGDGDGDGDIAGLQRTRGCDGAREDGVVVAVAPLTAESGSPIQSTSGRFLPRLSISMPIIGRQHGSGTGALQLWAESARSMLSVEEEDALSRETLWLLRSMLALSLVGLSFSWAAVLGFLWASPLLGTSPLVGELLGTVASLLGLTQGNTCCRRTCCGRLCCMEDDVRDDCPAKKARAFTHLRNLSAAVAVFTCFGFISSVVSAAVFSSWANDGDRYVLLNGLGSNDSPHRSFSRMCILSATANLLLCAVAVRLAAVLTRRMGPTSSWCCALALAPRGFRTPAIRDSLNKVSLANIRTPAVLHKAGPKNVDF